MKVIQDSPFDLDRARRETPGCGNVMHFNNAGAALPPQQVLDAMVEHLRLEAAIGGYEAAARAESASDHAYDAVAKLLNCRRNEIAIVENATRAWDMAFYGLRFAPGDRILTAGAEYASNYIPYLQVAQQTGVEVEAVPDDEAGQFSVEALSSMIDERVKLISITHVPTNGGLVNPAAEIGKIARAARIPYLLDACQSVGQMPIDVEAIGCDMLSATGRKFLRGPRGIGFLYVRRSMLDRLEPPFLDLHSARWVAADRYELQPDSRRFENWESNPAAKIGLGVAVDYALSWGLEAIQARVYALAELLRSRLADLHDVQVHDSGVERCGIVSFTVMGHACEAVKQALAVRGINVSVSDRYSTWLDMSNRGLEDVVRASVHYYNSESEVERFSETLADALVLVEGH